MAWRKSPPELIAAFDAALPADRRVQRRKMFGYPCAFTGGNMFTGLHQESCIVRLPETERARLLREPGASIFAPMPGRQMKEYVALPPAVVEDGEALRGWMTIALDYASALPAKGPRPPARAKVKDLEPAPRAKAKVTRGASQTRPRGGPSKAKAAASARPTRGARER
jgi:TfoX/Sxy family transcriptional regulator of competence genes